MHLLEQVLTLVSPVQLRFVEAVDLPLQLVQLLVGLGQFLKLGMLGGHAVRNLAAQRLKAAQQPLALLERLLERARRPGWTLGRRRRAGTVGPRSAVWTFGPGRRVWTFGHVEVTALWPRYCLPVPALRGVASEIGLRAIPAREVAQRAECRRWIRLAAGGRSGHTAGVTPGRPPRARSGGSSSTCPAPGRGR